MLELLNTKAAASAAASLFAPDPGANLSGGGTTDARSFFDGSGWTVSTGRSSATGARDSRTGDPFGAGMATTQAGLSPWLSLLLAGAFGLYLLRKVA